ncbi:hypothetical protein BaRGS_00002958 [Batillaria attramentaria]|uniref:XK-related protein n=1 Tax=Batillaria attramentaria TaxID=370345 RepID=A0ABD0M248_9CAEN
MLAWFIWASDRSVLLGICFGNMMVFYIPFHPRPSRYFYFLYYVTVYTENFLVLGLWAGMTSDRNGWFYIPVIVTVIVFFILHLVMMFLYYKVAHPKAQNIIYCVKWVWEEIRESLTYKYYSDTT